LLRNLDVRSHQIGYVRGGRKLNVARSLENARSGRKLNVARSLENARSGRKLNVARSQRAQRAQIKCRTFAAGAAFEDRKAVKCSAAKARTTNN
jgi:hypothetical protein